MGRKKGDGEAKVTRKKECSGKGMKRNERLERKEWIRRKGCRRKINERSRKE